MKKKIFLLLVFFVFAGKLIAQYEQIAEQYNKREYEKCMKKCDNLIDKKTPDPDPYYYRALCLWEMAQAPKKWELLTTTPLEDCLKAVAKLRQRDEDGSFFKAHKDTLAYIKQMADEAASAAKETSKTEAVRLLKLTFKAFNGEIDALQLVDIYIKAGDSYQGYMELDNLYAYASPNIDASSSEAKAQSMMRAPRFLIDRMMFDNAFELMEKYKDKFAANQAISNAFINAALFAMDTLVTSKDRDMYFGFSRRALKLFQGNETIIKHFRELNANLLQQTEKKWLSKTPESWRDTLPLRDLFKYYDQILAVMPDSAFYAQQADASRRYNLGVVPEREEAFARLMCKVLSHRRRIGYKCANSESSTGGDTLVWNPILAQVASEHARNMFAYNYTDHTDKRKRSPRERVDESELKLYRLQTFNGVQFYGAVKVEEAISYGFALKGSAAFADYKNSITGVLQKWLNSKDGDCENIMNYEFNQCGVGVFGDRWVLLIAKVIDSK